MMADRMKIGDLARLTGKTVRTIRYYEELGLLTPVDHTKGGFRLYGPDMVGRIELVDKFRALGMGLEDIVAIMQCYKTARTGREAGRKLLDALKKAREEIESRIVLLERFKTELEESSSLAQECSSCTSRPAENSCSSCRLLTGHGELPSFMKELVR